MLKHLKKSAKSDPADTTLVGATNWNADHYFLDASEVVVGALGDLPFRGSLGLVDLLSGAAGVLTSAGSGNIPAWTMVPTVTSIQVGNGSNGSPAFAFATNLDTGFYYSGGAIGVSIDSVLVTYWLGTSMVMTGDLQGAEISAPAAPAANGFRLYAQDNGAGKTQLMVVFSSGAAQQIAIQP